MGGFPFFEAFGVGGQLYSNFLAPTVRVTGLKYRVSRVLIIGVITLVLGRYHVFGCFGPV